MFNPHFLSILYKLQVKIVCLKMIKLQIKCIYYMVYSKGEEGGGGNIILSKYKAISVNRMYSSF